MQICITNNSIRFKKFKTYFKESELKAILKLLKSHIQKTPHNAKLDFFRYVKKNSH